MPSTPPQDTQLFTIYRHLYHSFIQRNVDKGPLGCSIKNDIGSLCGACSHHTHRPTLLTSRLFRMFVPTVYAAETTVAPEGDVHTIAEKVAVSKPKIHISDMEIEDYLAKETGMDRVREMYSLKADQVTPDLALIIAATKRCGMFSFIIATYFGARQAKEDFVRENQHTKFATKIRAARMRNDAVILAGLRNGATWGFKTAIFTLLLVGTSQTRSVYRNKTSPVDYVIGAAVTGGCFKISLGPKGIFAGSVIGAVLGLIGGLVLYGAMVLGNETQDQRHYWQVHSKMQAIRETQLLQEGAQKAMQNKADHEELTSLHDDMI